MVKELGFHVGQSVFRKGDKTQATIVAMAGNKITIQVDDGPITGEATVSANSFRKGEWKLNKRKPEPIMTTPCCAHSGLKSAEMKHGVTKGKILEQLLGLEKKHEKVLDGLIMQIKPTRAVKATECFKKGKLIIVPCSYKIETRGTCAAGSLALGVIDGQKFQIAPCFHLQQDHENKGLDESFLHPLWSVRTTNKQDDANMTIVGEMNDDSKNDQMKIPTMVNTCDISVDEVLKRYVPKESKTIDFEALVPTSMPPPQNPPLKRQRTKGNK